MATMKTDQHSEHNHFQFTGRHMALVMVSFFAVIILVNLTMAYLASQSWSGLVVKNGYIASQRFNSEQNRQEDLLASGWHSTLDYKEGEFLFQLSREGREARSRSGQFAEGCAVSGLLSRPVHERSDVALKFVASGHGTYSAVHNLIPGNWELKLKAICPQMADEFIQHFRFVKSAAILK